MNKKITLFGILLNGLLIIAAILSLLHIPNFALLILTGIFIMLFIEVPLFLVYLNKAKLSKRSYNILSFFSFFLFPISLVFLLQNLPSPLVVMGIIALLTGFFILYFVINEIRKNRLKISKFSFIHYYILFIILLFTILPIQEQATDYAFRPRIVSPAYSLGKGPVIYFDEGHNEFHTLKDRLFSTGRLLEDDGYIVKSLKEKNITKELLSQCKILIIPNALNDKNVDNWSNPTYSAFSKTEIELIKDWVFNGGSLFLITDHMPMPGAVNDLAKEFGFELKNGHAKAKPNKKNFFYRANNSLSDNEISNGKNKNEAVDSILAFDGSGFLIPEDATSILTFDSSYYQWEPNTAWDLNSVQPYSIKGYSQGAFKEFGKGKVVIYGEAMMFTAQLGGGLSWMKLGMNSKAGYNNYKLFLNSIHWLDK
jgi:hypothetical protein